MPDTATRYFCGIDVGAYSTKIVLIDDNLDITASNLKKNRLDIINTPKKALQEILESTGIKQEQIARIVSTGYGRLKVENADESVTEITCHGLGAYHFYKKAVTVIDIGGQDNKIIQMDDSGKRVSFKMNRKCAAGTGAFLDEVAGRLDVPVSELNGLAERATKDLVLGSFCTVFTATEILALVSAGEKVEDIVRGVFISLSKHLLAMATIEGDIVMTGGVAAHNPEFVKIFEERLGKKVYVHKYAHFAGALGAALYAANHVKKTADW